jgi:hypothetical protein
MKPKLFLSFFSVVFIFVFFRGFLFNQIVRYKNIGERRSFSPKKTSLIDYFEVNKLASENEEVVSIIKHSLFVTSKKLSFTLLKNEIDPNKLVESKTAHCVGYAAFFATTCNYYLKKKNLAKNWEAKPKIGQLYILGMNMHTFLKLPSLKDHDFVIIENSKTGETFAVDPTIHDYLNVDFVSLKK